MSSTRQTSSISRRALIAGGAALLTATAGGGAEAAPKARRAARPAAAPSRAGMGDDIRYAAVAGDRFPIPAVDLRRIGPAFLRTEIAYDGDYPPGVVVVDTGRKFLFAIKDGGRAVRYGVGVGREGFAWSGEAVIHDKQEWPDWYPPKEMLQRQPELMREMSRLRSGIGMAGGPRNPLGVRAMYLWQDGKDTLFRIHGTVEPWSIGHNVSSGCIRMINQDVMDLYRDTPVGTKVVVLGPGEAERPDGDAEWAIPSDIVHDRPALMERGLY